MTPIDERKKSLLIEVSIDLDNVYSNFKSLKIDGSEVLNDLYHKRTISQIIKSTRTGQGYKIRQNLDTYVDILRGLIVLSENLELLEYEYYSEEQLYPIFTDLWGEIKAKKYAYTLSKFLKEINDP